MEIGAKDAMIMRGISIGLSVWVLCFALSTAATAACRVGETLTINGKILTIKQFPKKWDIGAMVRVRRGCEIWQVQGDGKIPPGCAKGGQFIASGRVGASMLTAMAGDDVFGLFAERISCRK